MVTAENPFTSENYADLLIAYNGDNSVFNSYPNAPVHIINKVAAVVQIPAQNITNKSILEYGYATIPSLFGLVSNGKGNQTNRRQILSIPNLPYRGNGVLIGIIDTGIDYTNPIFQYPDKTTRIVSIWDQTIDSVLPPQDLEYGTEYSREQINQAIQSKNPYDIVPSKDENGHGTFIAGIAGGAESQENNFIGVAPETEFIVVKLKQAKKVYRDFFYIPDNAECYQETDIQYSIEYVLKMAAIMKRPVVLCIAVSTSQSAHDGRGLTSSYLSTIGTRPGIGVVTAAGDEGNAGRHFFGIVDRETGYETVELNIGENEKGFSMELWGNSPSLFTVDFTTPSGEYISSVPIINNAHREVVFKTDPTVINIDYRLVESESGDQLILMRLSNPTPGIWRINVFQSGDLSSGFHIWLPMEGFISKKTFFIKPDPFTTILALGNAQVPVTVTAYDISDDNLYIEASRGYNRLGDVKPNVAAPGVELTGPTLNHGFGQFTGTGASAAFTAGATAILLEWGIVKENNIGMSTVVINRLFMRNARRELGVIYPNREWGFGILDLFNVFESLQYEQPIR